MEKALKLMTLFMKGTGYSCVLAVIAYYAGMSNDFVAATLYVILGFAFALVFIRRRVTADYLPDSV